MAGPITWKNVSDLAYQRTAGALFESAGNSFNRGIADFRGVLDEKTAQDKANNANLNKNTTQAYKEAVSGLSLEELGDEEKIAGLKAQFGERVDDGVTNNFAADALKGARSDFNADEAFKKTEAGLAVAPALQELEAAINADDDELRDQLTRDNKDALIASGDWTRIAALSKSTDIAEDNQAYALEKRGRERKEYARQETERAMLKNVDTIGLEAQRASIERRATAPQQQRERAIDAGVADEAGNPISTATPDQWKAYQAAEAKAQNSIPTMAEEEYALQERLMSMPGITKAAYDQGMADHRATAAAEYDYMTPEAAAAAVAKETADTQRWKPHQNSFVADDRSDIPKPVAVANVLAELMKPDSDGDMSEIGQAMSTSWWTDNDDIRSEMTNAMVDAATHGVVMPDGTTARMTPAMIGLAMKSYTEPDVSKFWEVGVQEALQNYALSTAYDTERKNYDGWNASTLERNKKNGDKRADRFNQRLSDTFTSAPVDDVAAPAPKKGSTAAPGLNLPSPNRGQETPQQAALRAKNNASNAKLYKSISELGGVIPALKEAGKESTAALTPKATKQALVKYSNARSNGGQISQLSRRELAAVQSHLASKGKTGSKEYKEVDYALSRKR